MVYAMTFSGFYLAIMLVLFGLILRAVSLEFRHRDQSWSKVWDGAFFLGSLVPSILVGCALGNVIRGVPMNADGDYTGTFLQLLNPYSLLVAVTGLFLIVTARRGLAGAQVRRRAARPRGAGTARSPSGVMRSAGGRDLRGDHPTVSRASDNVLGRPLGWLFLVVLALSLLYTIWQMSKEGAELKSFLGSALTIIGSGRHRRGRQLPRDRAGAGHAARRPASPSPTPPRGT